MKLVPTESDYENENMTMDRIAREEMQIASMKVDLGGFENQGGIFYKKNIYISYINYKSTTQMYKIYLTRYFLC